VTGPDDSSLLRFEGITRAYGRLRALEAVDGELASGETLVLFGPNGAGKTTLLRIASTLLTPTRGRLLFRGQTLDRRSRAAYRHRIGLVGHATFLYDELSAEENLLLHARLRGVETPARRVADLLEQVGLTERRHDRVSHFSRGMQQRLSLARALAAAPDILLLDEPFSGLDEPGTAVLTRLLRQRRQEGHSTLLCTHDLPLGVALADRFLLLERGRVRRVGACDPHRALAPHEVSLERLAGDSA
jgi:heme exporter protein A